MSVIRQLIEQAILEKLNEATKTGKDQLYAMDYEGDRFDHDSDDEEGSKFQKYFDKQAHKLDRIHDYATSKYKINYQGHPNIKNNKHPNPDMTFVVARGDEQPNAYIVHAGGNAANDKKLHVKEFHMGDDA